MTDTQNDAPQNAVVTECDLPDAPEKVWRALTVPDLLARWLPDAVGCEILAAEPNRLLRYRWRAAQDDRDSFVTFELTGTDSGGTHLRVDHRETATVIAFTRSAPRTPSAPVTSGTTCALMRWAA
jgi:uncharacterized protein YndB with AHSA1/START domain